MINEWMVDWLSGWLFDSFIENDGHRLEDSYLQFVGLRKNTAVKVVERVELVLKFINGTSEPVVHADVTYQSDVHVVRGVIQFFALTGETVFVSNQLALETTQVFHFCYNYLQMLFFYVEEKNVCWNK